jgi:predicted O-methyltransferase YrrM
MAAQQNSERRTPSELLRWHGGRALHSIYRADLGPLSRLARRQLAERSYNRTLVPVEKLTKTFGEALDWLAASRPEPVEGNYLEFGVCTGSSMIALDKAVATRPGIRLDFVGFDSFEGLPDDAPLQDDGMWKAGSFMSDRDRTQARLAENGIDATLVVGWFSDTLNEQTRSELPSSSAPLIMIDCDIYSAAAEALEFCEPHITGPTVIVFDDWHSGGLAERGLGEAKAWQEFRAAHPDIVEVRQFDAYNINSHIIAVDRREPPRVTGDVG